MIWLFATITPILGKIGKFARKTKVAQFECAVLVNEHVRRLEIAVDDTVEVQVIQALSQVTTKLLDSCLRQLFILLDQLEQISTGTILKDNPKMVPCLIPVVEL